MLKFLMNNGSYYEQFCMEGEGGEGGRTAAMGDGNTGGGEGFVVPDAYKEASWVNEIKSPDDMWKRMSDMQGLVGKKSIPTAESSPEDWDNFYSQLRPESADKYDFTYETEGDNAFTPNEMPEGYEPKMREIMHKTGLSNNQAKDLIKEMTLLDRSFEMSAEDQDKDFDERVEKTFGDKKGEALKASSRLMAMAGEEHKEAIASLNNAQLMAVVAMAHKNSLQSPAGKMPEGGDASQSSGKSLDDLRSELAKLRMSDEARDPTHADFNKNQEEIKRLEGLVTAGLNKL